jgi:hypothetical protein
MASPEGIRPRPIDFGPDQPPPTKPPRQKPLRSHVALSAFPEKNSQRGENCPRYARAAQVLFCRLGLLVDRRLGDFGERLVRSLFLIKRFLEQFDGVIQSEFFRPGL